MLLPRRKDQLELKYRRVWPESFAEPYREAFHSDATVTDCWNVLQGTFMGRPRALLVAVGFYEDRATPDNPIHVNA